jgi:hypothetical protein
MNYHYIRDTLQVFTDVNRIGVLVLRTYEIREIYKI